MTFCPCNSNGQSLEQLDADRPELTLDGSLDQLMYGGPFQPWLFSDFLVLRAKRDQQEQNKELPFDLALLCLFFKNVSESRI